MLSVHILFSLYYFVSNFIPRAQEQRKTCQINLSNSKLEKASISTLTLFRIEYLIYGFQNDLLYEYV